jgi:hypothetical protein
MIHLGEALGLGNSALLKKFSGLVIRQLERRGKISKNNNE